MECMLSSSGSGTAIDQLLTSFCRISQFYGSSVVNGEPVIL